MHTVNKKGYQVQKGKKYVLQICQQKFCLVGAFKCHKKAGDDACAHLDCIEKTGKCLHKAGLRLHHLPDFVVSNVL